MLARGTRPISRRPRALAEWLSRHRETTCKTVTVRRIGAGLSNIVSAVSDNEGLRWVLRERRPGVLRDFTREVTVLRALWRQNFPVARPVGHRDLSTGVPFVITSWIHGTVIH
ncbi:phosphotransferase, partial [Mycobacterium avium]